MGSVIFHQTVSHLLDLNGFGNLLTNSSLIFILNTTLQLTRMDTANQGRRNCSHKQTEERNEKHKEKGFVRGAGF